MASSKSIFLINAATLLATSLLYLASSQADVPPSKKQIADQLAFARGLTRAQPSGQCQPNCFTAINEQQLWEKKFRNVTIEPIDLSDEKTRDFANQIDLDIIVLRGGGWSTTEIKKRYKDLAAVYAECEIGIRHAQIIEADSYVGVDVAFDIVEENLRGDMGRLALAAPENIHGRIRAYHIRSFSNGNVGFAGSPHQKHLLGEESPVLNTIWITAVVNTESYKKKKAKGYLTEAHELGHVLTQAGHITSNSPNIMTSKSQGRSFNQEQCLAMRDNIGKNKLARSNQ